MGTYLKPKGIQSYLRIWGSYDPIGSNPSETKKGVLYECSVKNQIFGPFLAQNWPSKLFFFTLHPYNPHFWGSDGPGSMGS